MSGSERYSFSLTTFSPSGKLVQIEYAAACVAEGAPSVGIKISNGVVIAAENRHRSTLYESNSIRKIDMVTQHIGIVYSGLGPDYRLLLKQARKAAQQYYLIYKRPIPTKQLVQRVATVMQEYTQSGGVRPFGVSLLICGWDNEKPYLFQCGPSGAFSAWKATALGQSFMSGKTFLEAKYKDDLKLDEAIRVAFLTLKECCEEHISIENIDLGICDTAGFRRLNTSEIKELIQKKKENK